jgi:phage shock protein C
MQTPTQRLVRSRTEKMIAGVAGGIAQYLGVDPVLVRLAFVALFFTGIGALLYPLLWLLMPLEGGPSADSIPAGYTAPGQAFDEMRQQATRFGEEVREVFVAGGPVRKRRFDPMTGEPLDPEAEIPINNVGPQGGAASDSESRARLIGLVLIGIGSFIVLNMLLGPGFGKFLFPLLLVAAGVLVLRRGR